MTKVLVVDDEIGVLRSTELLLRELGYEVVTTAAHQDVPGLVAAERPDVLLQDVRMPGLDLDHLLRTLRSDDVGANVPVILFSASLDLEDVWTRLGVAGMLEKPFRPEELDQAIAGVVDGASPGRGASQGIAPGRGGGGPA